VLVDALVADGDDALSRKPTADLLRAPLFLRQLLFDQAHDNRRHFARCQACGFASSQRLVLGLLEAIARFARIALDLARYRRAVHTDRARYRACAMAAFHQGVNLATFLIGQLVVAFGHSVLREMWCPTRGYSPADPLRTTRAYTTSHMVWREMGVASRVLAALASPTATDALDSTPISRLSRSYVVYAWPVALRS
jgi:hypothetical protein